MSLVFVDYKILLRSTVANYRSRCSSALAAKLEPDRHVAFEPVRREQAAAGRQRGDEHMPLIELILALIPAAICVVASTESLLCDVRILAKLRSQAFPHLYRHDNPP